LSLMSELKLRPLKGIYQMTCKRAFHD